MPDKRTNEEKRVALYASSQQPTNPASVTHETPLEDLNLNWTERDLPERKRTKHVHRLHPYLGKFIPQLVEVFLRKYFSPGQTVFDPFVGSGTTLVQANELGINAIGYDISAFNILLGDAKTAHYDVKRASIEIRDILESARKKTQTGFEGLPLFEMLEAIPAERATTDNAYLNRWFAPQALAELLTYQSLIEKGRYEYKALLKVILCRAARSARLTTHFDLDFPKAPQTEPYWCYKHSRTCSPTTEAFKFLARYSEDTIKRIAEFASVRTNAKVVLEHADSRQDTIPPIDGVITSPPYVGLIDYHEQHAYAYHLLSLNDNRESEIGAAAKGSSQKAQKRYQEEIITVFRNLLSAMPSGGRCIVVAGDKLNLYEDIAAAIDVEVEHVLQRHVNRRTGRRGSEFYESVFIWRKP
jgi:hypothetical protein